MKRKLFSTILIVILLISAVNLITMRINIAEKNEQINSTAEKIREQKLKNNEYESILSDENTEDFYRSIAEDQLGYALNDEIIYIDITGQ